MDHASHAEKQRKYRAQHRIREHGTETAYTNGGCRCNPCRAAKAEVRRRRLQSHPEYKARAAEQMREWRRKNPEAARAATRRAYQRYRERHPPSGRPRGRPRLPIQHGTMYGYVGRKCRCAECRAAWAKYYRERGYGKDWARKNPEAALHLRRIARWRRRSRERSAPGYASREQIEARWDYYGNRCWICREPATGNDHVIPLALGGSNWPANIRPACGPCNARKGARAVAA